MGETSAVARLAGMARLDSGVVLGKIIGHTALCVADTMVNGDLADPQSAAFGRSVALTALLADVLGLEAQDVAPLAVVSGSGVEAYAGRLLALVERRRNARHEQETAALTVVRRARLHLRSAVMAYTDVVEYADGSVYSEWRRKEGHPHADGAYVGRERLFVNTFESAVQGRVDFERRGEYLVMVEWLSGAPMEL